MQLKLIQLADYKPHPMNSNTHPQEQITELSNSHEMFGQYKNVVVWKGYYLAGHGYKEAAEARGETELYAIDMSHLSAEEATALIETDNETARMSIIDEVKRAEALASLSFNPPGFDDDKMAALSAGLSGMGDDMGEAGEIVEDEPQVDKAEELQAVWQVETGDLWQLGRHRLICGDCTDKAVVDRLMDGKRADLMVTDPPYGMNLNADFSGAKSSLQMIKDGKMRGGNRYDNVIGDDVDFDPSFIFERFDYLKEMFLWGADYYAERIPEKNKGSWLVWDKRLDDSADKMYGSCFELCWSRGRHKRNIIRVKWAGVFGVEQEPERQRFHPTQKPLSVSRWIIKKYSNVDDLVIDLFLGSGSVLLAAEQTNRICYGSEISPKYCAVILQRYADLTGETPIKL